VNPPSIAPSIVPNAVPGIAPHIAYVLLWFPLSSETFIFREVQALRRRGLNVLAYSLYGEKLKNCSQEMIDASRDVRRMGIGAIPLILRDVRYWNKQKPGCVRALMREVLFRRWCNLEVTGESVWAFFAGFRLARLLEHDHPAHIHAPWAGGPATAGWVASRLTGIPFSLAGRAGDIYPPDGALAEKIRDSAFVRVNNRANVEYLSSVAPAFASKVHLVYNSLTLKDDGQSSVTMAPPVKILAVGRFARTKGFDVLLSAARLLKDEGFPFTLTLVGAGFQGPKLTRLRKKLGLARDVAMPGFLPHDRLATLLNSHDMLVVPSVVHATGDRDGIPNVIMEALSHRLPVVATDVCGITEVVRHGETGLISPQKDPAALARAIKAMASDRDRAVAMAEAGRDAVRTMFDPEANTKKLFDLFKSHLGTASEEAS